MSSIPIEANTCRNVKLLLLIMFVLAAPTTTGAQRWIALTVFQTGARATDNLWITTQLNLRVWFPLKWTINNSVLGIIATMPFAIRWELFGIAFRLLTQFVWKQSVQKKEFLYMSFPSLNRTAIWHSLYYKFLFFKKTFNTEILVFNIYCHK